MAPCPPQTHESIVPFLGVNRVQSALADALCPSPRKGLSD
jgi:hypothetical protein